MKIEYSYVYTEFPVELRDEEALLVYLREQAQEYARVNDSELTEGPPVLLKALDRCAILHDLFMLKWPAIRLFVSLEDLT